MEYIYSTNGLKYLDSITYPEINIEENAFTFIAGPSGCGKSTFLKMLNRTLLPKQGEIYFNNEAIKDIPILTYRKEMLLVPQEVFLTDSTIKNNFLFYYEAREQKIITDSEMKKFLSVCCIDFDLNTDCTTLSGGERQRVFLAIFLSFAEKVLLLDEPTAALDESTANALISNIKDYCAKENITVICVCHNNSIIEKFSDKTLYLGGAL